MQKQCLQTFQMYCNKHLVLYSSTGAVGVFGELVITVDDGEKSACKYMKHVVGI